MGIVMKTKLQHPAKTTFSIINNAQINRKTIDMDENNREMIFAMVTWYPKIE